VPGTAAPAKLDARLRVLPGREGALLAGVRCQACGYRIAGEAPWCPKCRGAVEPAQFGPRGVVWSVTTVWIGVQDRATPYTLAYVDLDDGPRILAHVEGADPVAPPVVGARVALTGTTIEGDPAVEVTP